MEKMHGASEIQALFCPLHNIPQSQRAENVKGDKLSESITPIPPYRSMPTIKLKFQKSTSIPFICLVLLDESLLNGRKLTGTEGWVYPYHVRALKRKAVINNFPCPWLANKALKKKCV